MPELPEVETIRRHLAPFVEGHRLKKLEILDARWCEPADPAVLSDAVRGKTIEKVGRRGKYLIWTFEDEVHLVMHLRMTGNLLIIGDAQPPYVRVLFPLQSGDTIAFTDPRRFGTGVVLLGDGALEDYFAKRIGVEPLSSDF